MRLRGNFDVRAVALPIMETLRDRLGETVNLTVREGDQVVYIEKATPNRMIRVQQLVGARDEPARERRRSRLKRVQLSRVLGLTVIDVGPELTLA